MKKLLITVFLTSFLLAIYNIPGVNIFWPADPKINLILSSCLSLVVAIVCTGVALILVKLRLGEKFSHIQGGRYLGKLFKQATILIMFTVVLFYAFAYILLLANIVYDRID